MYSLIRPLLFSLDAEKTHHLSLSVLDWIPKACFKQALGKPVLAMGLSFPHQVGLAAGLDKNGSHLDALAKLGFAFIELGTVTPRPQSGNPKPRLFRLPQVGAIINRMGFNNLGVDTLVANVARAKYRGILGINIGKNKDTPLVKAIDDYLYCLRKVYQQASYVTINISSPNTPDLRLLQQEQFFENLLQQLCEAQKALEDQHQRHVPLLIKLSPDEPEERLKQMAEVIVAKKIAGVIATNTTCDREGIKGLPYSTEEGGLSGKPLAQSSTKCLTILKEVVGNEVTLIGVGGIDNLSSAKEKLTAGASLLQVYTGLIYQGPALVSRLVEGLK